MTWSLPAPVVVAIALVTQLGDVWFYFLVLGSWYWLGGRTPVLAGDRRRAAGVVGLAVGAMALTVALKAVLAFERPPGAGTAPAAGAVPLSLRGLYGAAATADGYGFPSGHALGTTAIWGAVAWFAGGGEGRPRRLLAAAGVVAVVALSRLALGVHYPVSVVGGILVGLGYLVAAIRLGAAPRRTFALAAGLALVAAVATRLGPDAAVLLGVALGGLATWLAVGERVQGTPATRREAALTLLGGVVLGGVPLGAALALAPPWPVGVALGGAAGVAVLALPLATARVERRGRSGAAQNFSR